MTTSSVAAPDAPAKSRGGARVAVQKFGTFLSGMVMPNIAIFIAWGIITAFFIETGWTPVGILGGFGETGGVANVGLVGPILTYLIPLAIAIQGGRMVYETRGAVVGSIMTMGVIIGASGTTMILGAMICGPLGAYLIKQIDRIWDGKIKPGFEMLVNNYAAGILGFVLAMIGFFWLAPLFKLIAEGLGDAVNFLVQHSLLPLASVIIEPAKVFFLNNAINHGVLDQLGAQQVQESGKSILFLLEANPGPGLGILLAFTFFGVGIARSTAPGAIIIQFLGGIHEIYFPYVLQKPILFIAVILGGATGVATNVAFHSGLVAPASPGSIFAVLGATAKDSFVGVILSVIFSAAVSFAVASFFLIATRKRDLATGGGDMTAAFDKMQATKGRDANAATAGLFGNNSPANEQESEAALGGVGAGTATTTRVENVVFACDAGMGSSAMGASVLRNKIKKAGIEGVTVVNKAIANLSGDEDLIITQEELTDRAKQKNPNAQHVSVGNFMNAPQYDQVVDQLKNQ
ncbi:PTS system D-mannitol-specific IIA component (Fru family) /PTS system D-mannitol-specific IIB component (Fru family) /PTS system D-mannitol-specific IIC component (Fru family) [Curtobacterium sp. PhB130]|uniref:PTS mannitol transporter subunit IICB n=1 Tax=unclassified Curtobacterium TaxID=257496 RepID=UPI000FB98F98|nr:MULTISPECIES: PTS mannitol transporter subunit IICB [unclassified Curtobacterium]ROP60345.1 PTS system D-mannitol-specific IIA component (Fru family) /PTS system D-mannitol-specific IIB component (Fru family) /PTS system D-mannitol-specific IIC component (Fru family) [Curtobacterium sp. ZW137]ROS76317.1 PTS system D-mannitol-specific IIA component (Fru family) /PTS system D-mannitol-specific IIB component (Fru family) /PTS system D-mannitol-specific IIC component (Fru family) [Curtobacterium s